MLDCVEKLQRSGIDVILIGFFQQNECWVNEKTENTILYNHTIADVAKKSGVPFVDIYSRWQHNERKNSIEDMTSDYMHHPTDFGHKIYFTEIVPYFLDRDTRINENFIY